VPTIGLDCQVILDGTGYWLEPTSYQVARPRVRRADLTGVAATLGPPGAGVGERYIDRGPGKRIWTFTIAAYQAMKDYAGNTVAQSGQAYRDALQLSYNKVNQILAFTDPAGAAWSIRFDELLEDVADVRAQVDSLQYYLHCTLAEA